MQLSMTLISILVANHTQCFYVYVYVWVCVWKLEDNFPFHSSCTITSFGNKKLSKKVMLTAQCSPWIQMSLPSQCYNSK